jgi:hypothetical protein
MKYFCCYCLILVSNLLVAQVPDSTSFPTKSVSPIDSSLLSQRLDSLLLNNSPTKKKKNFIGRFFDKKDYPNPKKALYLSLIFPGAGQIYNKQYWKAPIVWGGYTAAILNIRARRIEYRFFRDNRIAELDDDPNTINLTGLDERSLQALRDNAQTNSETAFLIILAVHTFQAADAFVFSHLKTFDVNEDLTLQINPQMSLDQYQQRWNAGVQVALSFSNKPTPTPRPF